MRFFVYDDLICHYSYQIYSTSDAHSKVEYYDVRFRKKNVLALLFANADQTLQSFVPKADQLGTWVENILSKWHRMLLLMSLREFFSALKFDLAYNNDRVYSWA